MRSHTQNNVSRPRSRPKPVRSRHRTRSANNTRKQIKNLVEERREEQRLKNEYIARELGRMAIKPKMTFEQRKAAGLLPRDQYLKNEQRLAQIFHTSKLGSSLNANGLNIADLPVLKVIPEPKPYVNPDVNNITETAFRRFSGRYENGKGKGKGKGRGRGSVTTYKRKSKV
jgi:hypothetical protein